MLSRDELIRRSHAHEDWKDGDVHVVIAPDCFTGTLTAQQAAQAMAQGWAASAPHDLLTLRPLSDGGPGSSTSSRGALPDAQTLAVTVADPLGREVPAALLVVDDGRRRTAYLESAQAAGLHLLAADERNPALTSTWGVGQLLEAALAEGATRIVVGLGGSATNDAGAGLLAALGAGAPHDLARGGLALADVSDAALPGLVWHASVSAASSSCSPPTSSAAAGAPGHQCGVQPAEGRLSRAGPGPGGRTRPVRRGRASHGARADRPADRCRPPARQDAGRRCRRRTRLRPVLLGGTRVSGVEEVLEAVGCATCCARPTSS